MYEAPAFEYQDGEHDMYEITKRTWAIRMRQSELGRQKSQVLHASQANIHHHKHEIHATESSSDHAYMIRDDPRSMKRINLPQACSTFGLERPRELIETTWKEELFPLIDVRWALIR